MFSPAPWPGIGVPHDPAPFVMVGMMSCIGSIARAPIAVMLMVAEMTGSAVILVPAMIAVGIAYCIVSRAGQTIFASQVRQGRRRRRPVIRVGVMRTK